MAIDVPSTQAFFSRSFEAICHDVTEWVAGGERYTIRLRHEISRHVEWARKERLGTTN